MNRDPGPWRPRLGAVCLFAAIAAGCGGGARLSGRVTYKGEPAPGTITLQTTISGTPSAYPAAIGADGRFMTVGVPTGVYQVGFTPAPPAPAGSSTAGQAALLKHVDVPAKYLRPDTSGLTWEVTGSSQTRDFDLAD